ncbi:hypothetical protein [Fibrobacter sp.]
MNDNAVSGLYEIVPEQFILDEIIPVFLLQVCRNTVPLGINEVKRSHIHCK